MKTLKAIADYLDGAKQYLLQVLTFLLWCAVRLHLIKPDIDVLAVAGMAIAAGSGFIRSITWKPGGLTDAEVLHQPDGGAIVVKPPPVQP